MANIFNNFILIIILELYRKIFSKSQIYSHKFIPYSIDESDAAKKSNSVFREKTEVKSTFQKTDVKNFIWSYCSIPYLIFVWNSVKFSTH